MSFTYQTVRKETNGNTVELANTSKAYTSLGFKNNTTETPLTQNTWAKLLTGVAYTIGSVDSGNCQIINNGTNSYKCRYVDSVNALPRMFKMDASMFLDMSTSGASMKKIQMRMCYVSSGTTYNFEPFAQIESNADGEALSICSLFTLNSGDDVYFEIMNLTNNDDVIVKFLHITVIEI